MGMETRQPARVVSVDIANTTTAYTSGDQIGDVVRIPDAILDSTSCVDVESLVLLDSDGKSVNLEVYFLTDNPASATGDNEAADLSAADLKNLLAGSIEISSWSTLDNCSHGTALNQQLKIQGTVKNSKDLYVMLVARGDVTWSAENTLTLKIGLNQD